MRKFLQALFNAHDLLEIVRWLLPSGGVGTCAGGVASHFGMSTVTIALFGTGAFLLALSFLPRVKALRRLFGLADIQVPTETVYGMKAINQTISVDGRIFSRCQFEACTFRWNGGPWGLQECKVLSPRFETQNPNVTRTVDTLKALGFLEAGFAKSWHWLPDEHLD